MHLVWPEVRFRKWLAKTYTSNSVHWRKQVIFFHIQPELPRSQRVRVSNLICQVSLNKLKASITGGREQWMQNCWSPEPAGVSSFQVGVGWNIVLHASPTTGRDSVYLHSSFNCILFSAFWHMMPVHSLFLSAGNWTLTCGFVCPGIWGKIENSHIVIEFWLSLNEWIY